MRRWFTVVLLLLSTVLFAIDVDEEELQELGVADIEFINYTGPYETIETREQIRSIGRALGQSIEIDRGPSDFVFNGKYRIIHAVDFETDDGLDADIFIPLSGSRVDHIDNMRRIISGFLAEAYGYGQADADLLARWATIYNAVARGNIEFFTERYKAVVTDNLSAGNAGLSRRYDEWPGMSRVVIPLSQEAAPGVLGTVDPGELGDERVIEELRSQEDRGVEERQEMVDLTERVIEEREEAIEDEERAVDEEEERISAEEAAIEEEREAIERERQEAEELPEEDRAAAEQALDERERDVEERERATEEDRVAAEERREEVSEERQEVADLTDQIREERERIARDTRALLDEREISEEVRGLQGDLSPIYFLQVRDIDGVILGRLVQINPVTGLLLNRSTEDQIVSRGYTFYDDHLLVIVSTGDDGRLAQFDVTSLDEVNRGEDEVFLASSMQVYGDPPRAYAVVRDGGEWRLGRFDDSLELTDSSVLAVNPYTTLAFAGERVWIQTVADRIVALSLSDLRIAP
ncbi:MAG: P83/100 family protein [Spirochaetota bacterium]